MRDEMVIMTCNRGRIYYLLVDIVVLPKNDVAADETRQGGMGCVLFVLIQGLERFHQGFVDKHKRSQVPSVLVGGAKYRYEFIL